MRRTICLLALLAPAAAGAQATSVRSATALRAAPGGAVVAQLHPGTPVTRDAVRGAWTQITVEGFVNRSVLRGRNQDYPISAADGATLRGAPSPGGRALARLGQGMGLRRVSTHGEWVRVRRTAWVPTAALAPPGTATARAKAPRPPAPPRGVAAAARRDSGVVTRSAAGVLAAPDSTGPDTAALLAVEHRAPLRLAPDGAAIATLDSTARVTTVARDRGWVRVRLEGWVQAADLGPADSTVLAGVSAADLRAQPDRYRGRTVRWRVQKIALQTADPLRKGMAPDEPYLLARGPGSENALLYLALPPSLVETARRVDPLSDLVVIARVRNGRSEPSGVPLLDVISLAQQ